MKIFFDESGQTGNVIPNKKGQLYGKKQRHFILAGVIAKTVEEEMMLTNRYIDFKNKFNLTGEFKGTELFKENNKEILDYFIKHMLSGEHFYICCYDKRFYIATLISMYLFTIEFRNDYPDIFYSYCSRLSLEDEDIFITYCDAVKDENPRGFLEFLSNYQYRVLPNDENNPYKEYASRILKSYIENDLPEFDLPYKAYIKKDTVNVVNITALGESIVVIKSFYGEKASSLSLIHDNIQEFEEDFKDSFQNKENINLQFKDSKNEILLQYADNVASLYRRLLSHMIESFEGKKEWKPESAYMLELFSKIVEKLDGCLMKFVIPIQDQALIYSTRDMFNEKYPKMQRKNIWFNPKYEGYIQSQIDLLNNLDFKNAKL